MEDLAEWSITSDYEEKSTEETTEFIYVEDLPEWSITSAYEEESIEETKESTYAEEFEESEILEEMTVEEKLHTGKLTARKGYIIDSPCGLNGNPASETWYPDAPILAVEYMEKTYGFSNLQMTIREDGVRILSGTNPNGEYFQDLVVVAADIKHVVIENGVKRIINPEGTFERGDIIETSLGTGIIVDYCERAVNERIANGHVHIDIATNWENCYK